MGLPPERRLSPTATRNLPVSPPPRSGRRRQPAWHAGKSFPTDAFGAASGLSGSSEETEKADIRHPASVHSASAGVARWEIFSYRRLRGRLRTVGIRIISQESCRSPNQFCSTRIWDSHYRPSCIGKLHCEDASHCRVALPAHDRDPALMHAFFTDIYWLETQAAIGRTIHVAR